MYEVYFYLLRNTRIMMTKLWFIVIIIYRAFDLFLRWRRGEWCPTPSGSIAITVFYPTKSCIIQRAGGVEPYTMHFSPYRQPTHESAVWICLFRNRNWSSRLQFRPTTCRSKWNWILSLPLWPLKYRSCADKNVYCILYDVVAAMESIAFMPKHVTNSVHAKAKSNDIRRSFSLFNSADAARSNEVDDKEMEREKFQKPFPLCRKSILMLLLLSVEPFHLCRWAVASI